MRPARHVTMRRMGSVPRTLRARVRALPPYRLDALIGAAVAVEICAEILVMTELRGVRLLLALALAGEFGLGVALRRRAPLRRGSARHVRVRRREPHRAGADRQRPAPVLPDHRRHVLGGGRPRGRATARRVRRRRRADGRQRRWSTANRTTSLAFVFSVTFMVAAPMLFGHLLRNRARLNQALRDKAARAEQERAAAGGGGGERGAHADRRRAARRRRARAVGDDRAGGRRPAAGRAGAGAGSERVRRRRAHRARGADRAATAARRAAQGGRGARARAAAEPRATCDGLAQRATEAGLPVALIIAGAPRSLPAGVDLTAYRVVQEALGRARDGGSAGRADVTVTYGAADVAIEVRDDGGARRTRAAGDARARHGLRRRALDRRARRRRLARRGAAARGAGGMIGRLRRVPAWAWDALLSAGLLGDPRRRLAAGTFDGDHAAATAAAVAAIALLPLVRRRWPLATIYAWALIVCLLTLVLAPDTDLLVPFLGLFVFPYNAGLRVPRPPGRARDPGDLAGAHGHGVLRRRGDRRRHRLPRAVRRRSSGSSAAPPRTACGSPPSCTRQALRAEEERQAEAARAVADERRRIAREMHDVVAHSVSMMVIQAGGARRILDRDPARAVEAAALIERAGREALVEMRHLLGCCTPTTTPPTYAPQPTLARLDVLVERARAAGLPVTLEVEGSRAELSAGLDLAAYRVAAGGAHERDQARGLRAHRRPRALPCRRCGGARLRSRPRTRRRTPGRRRPRAGRHARARAHVRRRAARGPAARRRLRGRACGSRSRARKRRR